jgi:DNA invertase Pin-like site-specific DNA recombinase
MTGQKDSAPTADMPVLVGLFTLRVPNMATTKTKTSGPTMAYLYARISGHKQKGGVGLTRQDEGSVALCREMNWTVVEDDTFNDTGRSAFHGVNVKPTAALGGFLEKVRAGTVVPGSVLVVENLDRISRQDSEKAMLLFLQLIEAGVTIATVSPRMVYKSPLGSSHFLALAEFIRAHGESSLKQFRGNDRWTRNREAARGGTIITAACPRWLTADRKANKFILDKDKAKTIQKIFDWCIGGVGVSQITRRLSEQEVPPFETRKRKNVGRAVWQTHYVQCILRGRAVLGDYQPGSWKEGKHVPNGEPIPNYYPAVVEEETYYQAQAAMNGRKRSGGPKAKNPNLFVGLVWDVFNGVKFYTSNKANGLQLVSSVRWEKKLEKYSVPVFPYARFETAVLKSLREVKPSDLVPGHKGDKLAELHARLTEVTEAIAEIQPRLRGKNIGSLLDMVEKLDTEKGEIIGQIHAEKTRLANGVGDALGEIHGLTDLLEKAQNKQEVREKLRGRIALVVSEIRVLVLMSDRRIKKHRPKAAIAEIYFKTGAVRHVLIPWQNGVTVTFKFDCVPGMLKDITPDMLKDWKPKLGLPS